MHKKYVSWTARAQKPQDVPGMTADGEVLNILYNLSTELSQNPQLFVSQNIIWAYFKNASISARQFIERYGPDMAYVSTHYRMSLYGSVNGYESGQITAALSEDETEIIYTRLDETQRDFDEMVDVCIKISMGDEAHSHSFADILRHMDYTLDYLPIRRSAYAQMAFGAYAQHSADTYFRYMPMSAYPDAERYTDSLSMEQKKQLWEMYLEQGLSPLEFDNVLRLRKMHTAVLFSWELALKLSLGEMGITVAYENGFEVTDAAGKRLKFDYEKGSGAERLFLKILFPEVKK